MSAKKNQKPKVDIFEDDDLEWLELGEIPHFVPNPLMFPVGEEPPDPYEEMLGIFTNADYLHFVAKHVLNITLPPYQCVILDTLWRKRMPMLIASRGGSKCISGDSLCRTNKGLLKINEMIDPATPVKQKIIIDEKMVNRSGVLKNVDYGWNNGVSETIKITTDKGYTIEGTKNHPICVLDEDGKEIWKNLEEISTNDTVVINRSNYKFSNVDSDNLDLAWFIGALIGDGCLSSKYIIFTNVDDDIISHFKRICLEQFGKKVATNKLNPTRHDIFSVSVCSKIRDELGLGYKKAHFKEIPKFIRSSSSNMLGAFLSGLYDTDGYCNGKEIGYSTVSKQLALQVHQALLSFGIVSRLCNVTTKCNGKSFKSYKIAFRNVKNAILFKKNIGFRCLRKQKNLDIIVKRKSNTNDDFIPESYKEKLIELCRIFKSKNKIGNHGYSYLRGLISYCRIKSYNITFDTLKKILQELSSISDHEYYIELNDIIQKNRFYEKIKKIETGSNQTFDVHISDGNEFIANGFINHNSFLLGVYALLRMILEPGCKIVITGAGLRQSRQIFDYMTTIWQKAPVLRDLAGKSKTAGPRTMIDRMQFEIGDSLCTALPIGTGEKIRGMRANYVITDEFGSVPPDIFKIVIQGFALVASEPIDKMKESFTIKKLKREGLWTPEMERVRRETSGGNQIIRAGTATFSFNHFYQDYVKFRKIIESKGEGKEMAEMFGGNADLAKAFNYKDFAILQIPYSEIPDGILDSTILAQMKATLSAAQFKMECCARFQTDSDGFYKRSILEQATTHKPIITQDGPVQFSAYRQGQKDKAYVIGVDPAAELDNAAIVVIELNKHHRKIVHSWTTNKKKFGRYKQHMADKGIKVDEEYYSYISRKIRDLMRLFNTEHIIMDKNGGGFGIAEALRNPANLKYGEKPIYQIVDIEDPKADDVKEGLHILELISPTNEINSDANHGMLKDFEDKILLFPLFDTVELAKAIEVDKLIEDENQFDTYEDLVQEIEELKTELTTIVVTSSSTLGKEIFDTPSVKGENDKKGHLRKDRYSALLYANYYARNKDKEEVLQVEYRAVGGTKESIKNEPRNGSGNWYYGPGTLKMKGDKSWLKHGNAKYVRH